MANGSPHDACHHRIRGLAVLTSLALMGCATATIHRRGQHDLEGAIQSSNAQFVYVRTGDGQVVAVPRADIAEVDHPGNVAAVVGGVFAGGAVGLVVGGGVAGHAADGARQGDGDVTGGLLAVSGIAIGIPALVTTLAGLGVWGHSKRAAENDGPTPAIDLGVVPAPAVTDTAR